MEKKSKADRDFPMDSSDSDDIIVRHESDEEEAATEGNGETPATLAFWSNLPGVSAFFSLYEENLAEPIHR